jgi:branched-chain amino acid transport system substrate-binding protein
MQSETNKSSPVFKRFVLVLGLVFLGQGCTSTLPSDNKFLSSLSAQCETVIGEQDPKNAFTFGAILPLTDASGSPNVRGEQRKLAMAHALDQINRLEGVNGRRFRVRICDTRGGWVLGATDKVKALATYLIESDEKIQAIISGASSDTTAIQTVTKPAGILLLSISATAISLTHEAGEQLTWRMVASDWFQGTALGEVTRSCHQAVASESGSEIAVLGVTNIYGNSMWQVIQSLPNSSTSQFRYYPVETDHNNLDSMLTQIDNNGHSVMIVVGSTDMAALVFDYYKTSSSGQRPVIFLTDSNRNQEFLQLTDSSVSLERVYGTIPGAAESTNTYKTFELTFNALEGVEPAQGSYTAHSYDAIYSLALAHAHALGAQGSSVKGRDLVQGLGALNGATDDVASFTTDFTQIRSTLLDGGVVNVEGASGPLAFDQFGDLPSQVELWTIAEDMDSKRRFDSLGWIGVTKNGPKDFSINNPSVFSDICDHD